VADRRVAAISKLVDTVDGEIGRNRRDRLPGTKLGVDTVDDRLLCHPPDPETNALVRAVPGTSWILRIAGGELGQQPGVRPIQQRLTLDQRHFRAVRPLSTARSSFRLLPFDMA
jgi:hypothetical protein